MKYFYLDQTLPKGPYDLKELLAKGIQENSLVFREGLDDWTEARYVAEIDNLLEQKVKLPPTPSEKTKLKTQNKIKALGSSSKYAAIITLRATAGMWLFLFWLFKGFENNSAIESFYKQGYYSVLGTGSQIRNDVLLLTLLISCLLGAVVFYLSFRYQNNKISIG